MNQKNILSILTGTLLVALAAGCKSSDTPYSASFASVQVKSRSPKQIYDAMVAVFTADGYTLVAKTSEFLVFEEEGSRMDKLAYGSWVGETPVYVRVKVSMIAVGEQDTWRLQCNAYMVRDKGAMLEDEVKLPNRRSGPFQKLLDKVADRLEKQP